MIGTRRHHLDGQAIAMAWPAMARSMDSFTDILAGSRLGVGHPRNITQAALYSLVDQTLGPGAVSVNLQSERQTFVQLREVAPKIPKESCGDRQNCSDDGRLFRWTLFHERRATTFRQRSWTSRSTRAMSAIFKASRRATERPRRARCTEHMYDAAIDCAAAS